MTTGIAQYAMKRNCCHARFGQSTGYQCIQSWDGHLPGSPCVREVKNDKKINAHVVNCTVHVPCVFDAERMRWEWQHDFRRNHSHRGATGP